MPPRRAAAAAASSAKRAAEDLTAESDANAKRHKANGSLMAAHGAAAPVAAAAVSSSYSAASSPLRSADAALAAAAAAVSLPDEPSCSICMHAFPAQECKDEGGAGRVPRSLACPNLHTFCTDCLEGMVQPGEDRHGNPCAFVPCSLCRFKHELPIQQQPASAAAAAAGAPSGPTSAQLVRLIPINASLMESISQRRQLERMVRERDQQLQARHAGVPCIYPGCDQSALYWCQQCEGELCAKHDSDLHPAATAAAAASSSTSDAHRRIPLSERAVGRQAKLLARLAANGAKLRSTLLDAEKESTRATNELSALLITETARVEREVLAPIRARLAASSVRQQALSAVVAEIASLNDTELLRHESRIREALTAPGPLPAAARSLCPPPAAARSLCPPPVAASSSSSASVFPAGPARLLPAAAAVEAPLVILSRLHSIILQPAHSGDLARFFADNAVPSKLIYRASRDGFAMQDWKARCVGKGPTMTLVKVRDNGFVFGAYTHCKWPAANGTVADPSGRSFLFSLVNATGKVVRFSLRHVEGAIQLGGEIRFGADSNRTDLQSRYNFDLMGCGLAADHPKGNWVFSVDHRSSYQPDVDAAVECDKNFFAGQHEFAAAEIEVFEL